MSGGSKVSSSNGGDESVVCEHLELSTNLSSPQEKEVKDLKVDQILSVDFQDERVLAVSQETGNTVGSINWSGIERLIECIEQGFEYVARVLSVDGGRVRVRITPARR